MRSQALSFPSSPGNACGVTPDLCGVTAWKETCHKSPSQSGTEQHIWGWRGTGRDQRSQSIFYCRTWCFSQQANYE